MASVAIVASSVVFVAHAQDDLGYGDVAEWLNQMIKPSNDYWNCLYCGGRGVLVRTPDGFENDPTKVVVPATFWSNDLFAPSQLYPGTGDPRCPNDDTQWCPMDPETGESGPWNDPQVSFVVGSALGNIFPDVDNIQEPWWGYGVFYPTDSNAADIRCRYRADDGGFDCPGGWLDYASGGFTYDPQFTGAGGYSFGNPYGGGGGGGAGCHYNGAGKLNNIDGEDENGIKLVRNPDCECNYDLIGESGASDWFDHYVKYGGFLGPSSAMDEGACWVNNPRDMIKLQNELFWRREEWNWGTIPWARWDDSAEAQRPYWGWNEIPVDNRAVSDPLNWDAVLIKLPAMLSGDGSQDRMSMLSYTQGSTLEGSMFGFIDAGHVLPGVDNVSLRPGSSAVIVREWMDSSGNFQREFFCETWHSPNGYFKILYYADSGACFVDWGNTEAAPPHVVNRSRHTGNSTRDVLGRNSAISV